MTIHHHDNNPSDDSVSFEMLELSADELGQVAGGATTVVYEMRPIIVIGQRPKKQQLSPSLAFSF